MTHTHIRMPTSCQENHYNNFWWLSKQYSLLPYKGRLQKNILLTEIPLHNDGCRLWASIEWDQGLLHWTTITARLTELLTLTSISIGKVTWASRVVVDESFLPEVYWGESSVVPSTSSEVTRWRRKIGFEVDINQHISSLWGRRADALSIRYWHHGCVHAQCQMTIGESQLSMTFYWPEV